MKSLRKWLQLPLFGISLCLISLNGQAQDFPKAWHGTWKGPLTIHAASGAVQTVPMQLEIAPIDSIRTTFVLTYGSGNKTDRRAYELVTVDAKQGRYVVDEKNGIKIEMYKLGNRMLCQFDVQNSRLMTTYELTNPTTLTFEVMTSGVVPVSTTGETSSKGQAAMPSVNSYRVNGFQRAVLKR